MGKIIEFKPANENEIQETKKQKRKNKKMTSLERCAEILQKYDFDVNLESRCIGRLTPRVTRIWQIDIVGCETEKDLLEILIHEFTKMEEKTLMDIALTRKSRN